MALPEIDVVAVPIGERIRAARKAAGLSQVELARRLGVSQPAIATWESGAHDPRRVVLVKLADALGVSHHWLAAGERSAAERDRQAAAAYLRRPVHHVPIISFDSAAQFLRETGADPHEMAEDYISVTASSSKLFAVVLEDPAMDRAFPKGTLVVIDYADRCPGDGNFCLAAFDGAPHIRQWRAAPERLEPHSTLSGFKQRLVDDDVAIIGCARVSIRLH